MIEAARRALVVDFSLAGVAILAGAISGGLPRSIPGLGIAALGGTVFVGVLFVAEHTTLVTFVNQTRPMSLIVSATAFLAIGAALVLGPAVVPVPAATLLWGMGIGLAGYRYCYGIRAPMPAKRREQAELWGTPPTFPEPEEVEPVRDEDGQESQESHENQESTHPAGEGNLRSSSRDE